MVKAEPARRKSRTAAQPAPDAGAPADTTATLATVPTPSATAPARDTGQRLSLSAGWGQGPNEELFAAVLEKVSAGQTLRAVARELGFGEAAMRYQIVCSDDLSTRYARARQAQAEAWADEIAEISDDGTNDWMTIQGKRGEPIEVKNRDVIERSRLRVDTRKWLMAKLHPKAYGESVEVRGNLANSGAGVVNVTVNLFKNSPSNVKPAYPVNGTGGNGGGPQQLANGGASNGNSHPDAGSPQAAEESGEGGTGDDGSGAN